MRIGIVGAGYTGLNAALQLQKKGHTVSLFEKEPVPGGLAIGFQQPDWEWALEKHYHHIFTSDDAIRSLAKQIGHDFSFYRPNTSSLIGSEMLQLDSPTKLLLFHKLTTAERLRMATILGYLKYFADWRKLEKYNAHDWLITKMGRKGYTMLWEPLLKAKFGEYYKDISLAWFWARIKARTTQLGYPDKGFQGFAESMAHIILGNKGSIQYKTPVIRVEQKAHKSIITFKRNGNTDSEQFDAVLVTLPNIQFAGISPSLPQEYLKKLRTFKGIGAVNMVLELSAEMLPNDIYWLSICEEKYPFLAVVEHTHFIDKKHYNNKNIVYVGNYLKHGHKYFSLSKEELLKEYDPFLKKLNPSYGKAVENVFKFNVPFAQPIVTAGFSKEILPFKTPLNNVYLANMQQVYPWDRGTNFAIKMGEEVALAIHGKMNS